MTKIRAPLSIEQALARIAGQLPDGYESMAAVTGRSASLVRKYGDPDREEEIPVALAIQLDLAFQATGGEGHPIFDAYEAKLQLARVEKFAGSFDLLRKAAHLFKEGGEAHAAIARACLPDATDRDRAEAFRELAENLEAIKPLLAALETGEAANERAPP